MSDLSNSHTLGRVGRFLFLRGKVWEFLSRAIPSLFFGNLTSKFNFEG